MRRLLFAALLILAAALPATAQFTKISGQVVDPNGIPYSSARVSFVLVNSTGLAPMFQGQTFSSPPGPITLDVNGNIPTGFQVPDNAQIFCGGPASACAPQTTWALTVSIAPGVPPPQGTGPQTFSQSFTITGSSQTLTFAGVPVLSRGSGNGTGGTSSPAAPAMGFYWTSACPTSNTGFCFFTTSDVQQANDCSWTNASTNVHCNTPHFVSAAVEIGKSVMGAQTCVTDQLSTSYGGQISTTATPTITAFVDTQDVTISATPSQTATFTAAYPAGACFVWGHLDDSSAATIDSAMQAVTGYCPKLFQAAANYGLTSPQFFKQPAGCANMDDLVSATATFGNVILPAGFEIEGRGTGNTAWYLFPSFPSGDPCTHNSGGSAGNALHGGGCFAIPLEGKWRDFRIDGGGQAAPGNLTSKTLIIAAVAQLFDFSCFNYGGFSGGSSVGIELAQQVYLDTVNNSGCGGFGLWVDANSNHSNGYRVMVENSSIGALGIGGAVSGGGVIPSFTCYWCTLALSDNSPLGTFSVINNLGGSLELWGGVVLDNNGAQPSTNSGWNMYSCNTNAGGVLRAHDVVFGQVARNITGITTPAGCNTFLEGSTVNSAGTGKAYSDVAASKLFDIGGNSFVGANSITGGVFGSASITGTALVTGNIGLTSGWGTSTVASVGAGSDSHRGRFTVTGAAGAANPTLTLTFPTPFLAPPASCTLFENTTDLASLTSVASGTPTTTNVVFTFAGTPIAVTYIFDYQCGP